MEPARTTDLPATSVWNIGDCDLPTCPRTSACHDPVGVGRGAEIVPERDHRDDRPSEHHRSLKALSDFTVNADVPYNQEDGQRRAEVARA
jgi:hypothetical protein